MSLSHTLLHLSASSTHGITGTGSGVRTDGEVTDSGTAVFQSKSWLMSPIVGAVLSRIVIDEGLSNGVGVKTSSKLKHGLRGVSGAVESGMLREARLQNLPSRIKVNKAVSCS